MKLTAVEVVLITAAGACVIVVCGAVRSTVNDTEAGLASVLPAASVARTSNVCAPSLRPVNCTGETQGANDAPSRRHSKVDPASDDAKLTLVEIVLITAAGAWVIVVCGATLSTTKATSAGVESVFPAGSVARTRNVCAP
ncbi:MAG: hypothetical protein ACLGG9_11295 [Thermoleophilia bacterium]